MVTKSTKVVVLTILLSSFLMACPATNKVVKNGSSSQPAARVTPKKNSWKLVKGQKAPSFTLQDLNGDSHSLSKFKGKVILINFWATWCAPCLKEFPHFQTLLKRYEKQGFVILAINTDVASAQASVGPTIYRYGYTFRVLLDPEGRVITLYNPKKSRPYSVLIDRQGNIRMSHQGYNPGDEQALEKHIISLLKEAKK